MYPVQTKYAMQYMALVRRSKQASLKTLSRQYHTIPRWLRCSRRWRRESQFLSCQMRTNTILNRADLADFLAPGVPLAVFCAFHAMCTTSRVNILSSIFNVHDMCSGVI